MATSKERRLARRAADRDAPATPSVTAEAPEAVSSLGGEPPPKKKRRHLVQRKKKAPPPPAGEPKKAKTKSAAQLKRNAERALARGEALPEHLATALSSGSGDSGGVEKEEGIPAEVPSATADATAPENESAVPASATPVVAAAAAATTTTASAPGADTTAIAAVAADAASPVLNARERRLARREAERNGETVSEDLLPNQLRGQEADEANKTAAPAPASADGSGGVEASQLNIPNVVFVGQLPYSATAEQIKHHIEVGGQIPASDIKVRVLTHTGTGKSKGMAFVELANAEQQHQALGLHRSYFSSGEGERRRQINVEKSSGGGRVSKRKRIEDGRVGQESYMKDTVARIIEDYVAKGKLSKEMVEEDRHLKEMLHRCDASTVDSALEEFSERGSEDLSNPAAYLTALVCRKLAEGFDARLTASKQPPVAGKGGKGGKGEGKGGKGGKGEGKGGKGGYPQRGGPDMESRFPSMRGRGRGDRR